MNENRFLLSVAATATELWAGFSDNDRVVVRFGMLPAGPVQAAEKNLKALFPGESDVLRLLAVALYDCAKNDGGMRA
jgi:hypothetical protein